MEPKADTVSGLSTSGNATAIGGKGMKRLLKVGVVTFSTIYLVLILIGFISPTNKFGPSEYAMLAFIILFVGDFFDKLAEMSIGKDGLSFRLNAMESKQDDMARIISAMKVALKGLVSKYEHYHLSRLEAQGPHMVHYGEIFFGQVERLDSHNLIRPITTNTDGFDALLKFKETPTTEFNLKDYMEITEEGKAYLQMRRLLQVEDYQLGK